MRQFFVGFFPFWCTGLISVSRHSSGRALVQCIFFGLVLLFGAGKVACVNSAYGQTGQIHSQNKKNFTIPAQPLSTALLTFGEQSGLSILVRKIDAESKMSPAVAGRMTARQALIRLLRGANLGFKYIDADTISISPDIELPQEFGEEAAALTDESLQKEENKDAEPEGITPVDEVIVTSMRRATNMQRVPVAVTVIKPPLIRETRIHEIGDIGTRVPGLTVASFSIGQPTIHVRGVGSNDDGAALDNSIVMFVDDVYVGRITAISMTFFDLDGIEIMRGPQGTLYGKNAIGGAINVTSKMPTDDLS